jgi:membrane protein YqaA with SNARE-associated domain
MLFWLSQTPDQSAEEQTNDRDSGHDGRDQHGRASNSLTSIIITVTIIVGGIVLAWVFKDDILRFGERLLATSGDRWADVILFLLTAVSSTPLALPVWVYAVIGTALGMNVIRLSIVMAFASATGSLVTLFLGRYFGNTAWVRRRFPRIHDHPWTEGRSRAFVTALLFIGTASPIPCDVLFVACGAKKYPALLFWVTMIAARFIHYLYIGYGFTYFRDLFDYVL